MPGVKTRALDFEGLKHLDNGRINKLLLKHLQQAINDCRNRPDDAAARNVTLKFNITPMIDIDTRECTKVKTEIECTSKVPVFRSQQYQMQVSNNGLLFNEDFPDDFDQESLYGDQEEGEGTR